MSRNIISGIFDPGIIRQTQNNLDITRGHDDKKLQNMVVLSVYKKDGRFFPVNRLVGENDIDLESTRLSTVTLPDMHQAYKYMDISLALWNQCVPEKDTLGVRLEALHAAQKCIDKITALPASEAFSMGASMYNPNGTKLMTF